MMRRARVWLPQHSSAAAFMHINGCRAYRGQSYSWSAMPASSSRANARRCVSADIVQHAQGQRAPVGETFYRLSCWWWGSCTIALTQQVPRQVYHPTVSDLTWRADLAFKVRTRFTDSACNHAARILYVPAHCGQLLIMPLDVDPVSDAGPALNPVLC